LDSSTTIDNWFIWGSPWQPYFHNWAFNLQRGPEIKEKWDLIPNNVDILMTHGPPEGHGAYTFDAIDAGCADLLDTVKNRVKPLVHVFGHIHEGYGVTSDRTTMFINGSICTFAYQAINKPIVFDLIRY